MLRWGGKDVRVAGRTWECRGLSFRESKRFQLGNLPWQFLSEELREKQLLIEKAYERGSQATSSSPGSPEFQGKHHESSSALPRCRGLPPHEGERSIPAAQPGGSVCKGQNRMECPDIAGQRAMEQNISTWQQERPGRNQTNWLIVSVSKSLGM